MTPKELFQQDKAACNSHNATINEKWFQQALAYAKAEMFSQAVTKDMLQGAAKLEEIFLGLSAIPSAPITFSTGITHDVDNPLPKQPE